MCCQIYFKVRLRHVIVPLVSGVVTFHAAKGIAGPAIDAP